MAPLHRPPTVQMLSLAQALVAHLALLQTRLTLQPTSPAQAAALPHLAPLHVRLLKQALSAVQAGGVPHVAPLHS